MAWSMLRLLIFPIISSNGGLIRTLKRSRNASIEICTVNLGKDVETGLRWRYTNTRAKLCEHSHFEITIKYFYTVNVKSICTALYLLYMECI